MENKNVGWLIIGLSIVILIIVFLFNSALRDIVESSCTMIHGSADLCPMDQTINKQTYLSLAIVGLMFIIGLFLVLSKQKERIIIKKVKDKKQSKIVDLSGFRSEEKTVYNLIKEQGAIFQAELIEKTGFGKAKISRIIDRLEGHGFVERKRRGMTNIVVLKD